MRRIIGYGALLAAIILTVVLAVRVLAPDQASSISEPLAYRVGWLVLVLLALFIGWRETPGNMLKSLLTWAVIFSLLIVAYSMRGYFTPLAERVLAELSPGAASTPIGESPSGSAASLRRALDGHFWAEANVDGTRVRFLVDTGATSVALTRTDAQRVGIDLDSLAYNQRISTANGVAAGAMIRLDEIRVGNVRVRNVSAIIPQADVLPVSLLGMSFLGKLSRYEATQQNLILRQ